jgi:hypothetical protein
MLVANNEDGLPGFRIGLQIGKQQGDDGNSENQQA